MSISSSDSPTDFRSLGLPQTLLAALSEVGYEVPSPIQSATIPPLLEGRDLLGQAQTGTGKTAAFALPILARIDLKQGGPQALVLAPTRELAIQVAEAFQRYAAHLPGFHVLPIYGGQSYEPQLRGLRRGVHVVVGTPGRVVDHIKRGTLRLDALRYLVLDEADEMLRMGFVEDIEWILQQAPAQRQIALFSATMPTVIRRIAQTHLRQPVEITIKTKTTTAANIRQRYWLVGGMHKLDALTRILEAEPFEAMIVFARTKLATEELASKLQARGFDAAALNGDVQQAQRERLVAKLKDGSLDILVATDVAARGLDVERISHVVNYDVPTDTESYVHRIGRTGRAGRSGEAILFVAPRERHLLRAIERATRQPIESMALPSADIVNAQRIARFKERIGQALAEPSSRTSLMQFQALIGQYAQEQGVSLLDIAAALACMSQGSEPLLLEAAGQAQPAPAASRPQHVAHEAKPARSRPPLRAESDHVAREPQLPYADLAPARPAREEAPRAEAPRREKPRKSAPDEGFETYRVEVGHQHGVKPGNLVGAIANEAGLDSEYIGRIDIRDDHSLIDLPQGMPKAIYRDLQKTWVAGRQLRISRAGEAPASAAPHAPRAATAHVPGKTHAKAQAGPHARPQAKPHAKHKPDGFKPGHKKRPVR